MQATRMSAVQEFNYKGHLNAIIVLRLEIIEHFYK